MMNAWTKRRGGHAALWTAVWLLLTVFAQASGGTLTLHYAFDGVPFAVYRVAEKSGADYVLTAPFDDCKVRLPSEKDGASRWRDAAETLAGCAAGEHAAAQETVQDGQAAFTGLADGLYLVVGGRHTQDGAACLPVVFLAEVSGGKSAGADVKWDSGDPDGSIGGVTVTVRKLWQDDDPLERPENVELRLLCDGTPYEDVRLEEANGWQYSWHGLDAACRWQVVEPDVPEGYTVSVSREGWNFTVTNTVDAPREPVWPGGLLPQTGQLWWPAAVLAVLGVLLIWADCRAGRRK